MELVIIILLFASSTMLFSTIIRYVCLRKYNKNDDEVIFESGAFKQSIYCKHQDEYLCIKCGDCGRKFVK